MGKWEKKIEGLNVKEAVERVGNNETLGQNAREWGVGEQYGGMQNATDQKRKTTGRLQFADGRFPRMLVCRIQRAGWW